MNRVALLTTAAILLTSAPAWAQPWRQSVLALAPADTAAAPDTAAADSVRVGPESPADTAKVPSRGAHATLFEPEKQPPYLSPVLSGLAGGAVLAVAGTAIGVGSDDTSGEFIPVGAFLGYFAGETLGVALGVHLGNRQHGNFLGDYGVSILGQLATLGLASATGGPGFFAGCLGQVMLVTLTERSAGQRHIDEHAARAAGDAP